MQPRATLVRLVLSGFLATGAARADVLRVGGPLADHPSIAAAAQAAQDGDTLLVYPGGLSHAPVLVDGKALTIVADAPARILLKNGIEVRNLAGGQTVVLEGFDVGQLGGGFNVDGRALSVRFCQGSVRVDDCSFVGRSPGLCELPETGYPGVYVTQSADVAFSSCEITGGCGKPDDDTVNCGPSGAQFVLGPGGPGAFVRASSVAFADCRITGGCGGYADEGYGADGGTGLEIRDGFCFLAGCTVEGGGGSDGNVFFPQGCGGYGGTGLELATAAASLEHLDSTFQGGAGGFGIDPFTGQVCPGPPGQDQKLKAGASFTDLGLPARTMAVAAPIRAGQPTAFHFEGLPGDKVFGMLSAQPAFLQPFPQAAGPKLVGALIRRLPLGTIDATGQLDVALFAPALPPGTESLTWHWQGLFVGTDGQAVVGDAEPWIVVDPAF